MDKLSLYSKLFIQTTIGKDSVVKLLEKDISPENLKDFISNYRGFYIPIDDVYKFVLSKKDLTFKLVNSSLEVNLKLFVRIRNHEQKGTWYSDDYTPYCGQMEIKCSGPRMVLKDFGYKCPECQNEIGFSGFRLVESPLNQSIFKNKPLNSYKPVKVQWFLNEPIKRFAVNDNTIYKSFKDIEVEDPITVMPKTI